MSDFPFISVVIPARNEEDNIAKSVGSLLKQDYPLDKFEIIVVDDFSTDKTRSIVEDLIADSDVNAKCISGRDLPAGWLGKSNACMTGALQATGEYIYFIDADTHSAPEMLRCIVDFAVTEKIDLLSFNPRQIFESAIEKAVLPGTFLSIASYMNFKDSNDSEKEEAIANGQAMLFKREAYLSVGGHESVAAQISEDIAFAKVMKSNGYKIFWAFADDLMSTHMYSSFETIWSGFSKNMSRIINCKTQRKALQIFIKSNLLAWTAPILLVISMISFSHDASLFTAYSLGINSIIMIALLIAYSALLKALFVPLQYALLVPVGVTIQSFLLLNSFRLAKNNNISWKGRAL